MNSTVETRLENVFSIFFPFLALDSIRQASMETMKEWDSVMALNLFVSIEEEFGIWIGDEGISKMNSFTAIAAHLSSKLGTGRA